MVLYDESDVTSAAVNRGFNQRIATELGLTTWSISLSHDGGVAIAQVVALGAG